MDKENKDSISEYLKLSEEYKNLIYKVVGKRKYYANLFILITSFFLSAILYPGNEILFSIIFVIFLISLFLFFRNTRPDNPNPSIVNWSVLYIVFLIYLYPEKTINPSLIPYWTGINEQYTPLFIVTIPVLITIQIMYLDKGIKLYETINRLNTKVGKWILLFICNPLILSLAGFIYILISILTNLGGVLRLYISFWIILFLFSISTMGYIAAIFIVHMIGIYKEDLENAIEVLKQKTA